MALSLVAKGREGRQLGGGDVVFALRKCHERATKDLDDLILDLHGLWHVREGLADSRGCWAGSHLFLGEEGSTRVQGKPDNHRHTFNEGWARPAGRQTA